MVSTKTQKTSDEKKTPKAGRIDQFLRALDLEKIKKEHEEMRAEMKKKEELAVFDYDEPAARRSKFRRRKSKKQVSDKKKKIEEPNPLKYSPYPSMKPSNKYLNVKTYWPKKQPIIDNQPLDVALKTVSTTKENEIKRDKPETDPNANKYFPLFNFRSIKTPTKTLTNSSNTLQKTQPNKSTFLLKTSASECKQLVIDAGQKKFGAIQCPQCNMVYSCTDPGDVNQHTLHHKKFLNALKFTGWKNEHLVASFMDGRIIKVLPTDSKYALNKVEEIREIVDKDLGFSQQVSSNRQTKTFYLYVSDNQELISFLIAEPLQEAFRVLPRSSDDVMMIASKLPEPVTCGISRIWTNPKFRKRGYASKMIDALRTSFLTGVHLDIDQIAFSSPTLDGQKFASKYCKTEQFFTYYQVA